MKALSLNNAKKVLAKAKEDIKKKSFWLNLDIVSKF
jgi:hypothetical protein